MRRTRITAATLAVTSALTAGAWTLSTAALPSPPDAAVVPVVATAPPRPDPGRAGVDPTAQRLAKMETRLQSLILERDAAARAADRAARAAAAASATAPTPGVDDPTSAVRPAAALPPAAQSTSGIQPVAPARAGVPQAARAGSPMAPAAVVQTPIATPKVVTPGPASAGSTPATAVGARPVTHTSTGASGSAAAGWAGATPTTAVGARPATHTSTGASGSTAPSPAGTGSAAGDDATREYESGTPQHRKDNQDD
ncbi:hypothetical protein ABIB25_000286 [Nakamurella sp. UYEF19]|uniref:hypothetical protein n=1 Tax=Nakamurella sp. UYEF19 TaxID=1756392 RepID=UPI003394AC16